MEDVQCKKLGSLVVLEDGNLDLGTSKTSFVDDKQHLESVLGQTRESWFEEFTINKIQIRKCEDVKETLSVMNSPSCSPTISQLIYGHLTVGSSPLRHSSPAPYCKDDSFIGRFNFETPQSLGRWNRPSVGRSPCPSPIVQNVLGISGLHGSLGADDSTLSWTSSLATPPRDTSVTSMDREEDCLAPRTKETARALFSPGSGLDSTNESIQPLDSTVEEMQSDGENHYYVDSNLSNVEIGCDKPMSEKLEVNTKSCEMVSLDVGNVKQNENNSKENIKKRQIKRNGFSTEKTKKLKQESNSISSEDLKDNDMQQVVVGNTVNENSCDKNVTVSISSPTFSQKVKCRKFCVRNTQLLASSPEVNSPVSDILSDFFDPPSSSLRRRRPAPSCKRKSLEMEEGSFCVTPKLAFHESQILHSSITPEVNLKSILSSDIKKKDSSNKKVRFSKSVKKCCYIPEQGSNARAPKSINKSKRRKSLIKSSNLEVEDEIVTVKEKYNCMNSNYANNRSDAITVGNEQNEETKEKRETETMSLESDNSCHGENKNFGRSNDLGIGHLPKGSKTISKESNMVDRSKNIDKSLKVITNGCQQKLAGRNKSNEVNVVDNGKNVYGVEQSLENESPKDELFSQVSPTCLNEMCSVAEHSVIHENNDDSIMSSTVKDERTPPMKGIINSERKTGKLLGRKKFFYPSISINSVSNSSKIFQFQEGHTDSKNKKKLLQSVSSKDMMVTMVTEKGDTNTETLNFTSDVERCNVVSDCVNVPEIKVNEKPVKLVETKLVSNEQNDRILKRNANMSVLAMCSSREDCKPELLDVAEPGKPIIGFHCASGKSLNISSTALDKAKTVLEDNVDYQTETNIKSPSYKTKCGTDIDRILLDTSRLKNTVYNDSNLISTRYSELSLSKTDKEADGADRTIELAKEQANCVLNAVTRFQSDSGKTCHISSSALKKAETLLEDDKSRQQPKTRCSLLPENKTVVVETESVSAVQDELQGSFSDGITPYVVANEEYEFSEWPDEDMDPNDDILFTSDVLEHDISKNGKEIDTEDSDKIVKNGLKLLKSDSEENNESDDNILHIKETCDLNSEIGGVCSYSDSKEAVKLREETNQLCQGRVVTKEKSCYEFKQKFVGFQMASGKTISIPDDKLKQAESMLDAESEKKNVDMADVENRSKSSQKFLGFHMASGKNINITEEKLKQAETLLDTENDKEKLDMPVNQNEVSKTFECRQMLLGFQMASGKNINITEEKLKQAETLLDTENDKEKLDKPVNQNEVSKTFECRQMLLGFQMASGKAIEITDDKLKHAEAVLDAENDGHSKFDIANCQDGVTNKIINRGISACCGKESDVCSSERDFLKRRDVGDRQTSNSTLTKYKHPEIRKEVNYSINVSSASLDSKLNSETNNIILKSLFENELKQDVHSMENELDMLGELKSKILNQRGEIQSKSKSPCVTNLNRSSNDGTVGHPASRRSLPQGFRPFKAPKIVTKTNVIENKDLKLNITGLKIGNENITVKPFNDSVTVNHGLKCDKTEQLPKVNAESPNTQGRKSTNVKVEENITNKLIGGDVCSPAVSAVISDNNQLHSHNKDDVSNFSIRPSENFTEMQKSSVVDRNDNDLFQGLSQFFEDEMELEENNVQYGETDDIAASLNDNSTKINSNERSSNFTQNVDLTEEASPNSASLSLNSKGDYNNCFSDTSGTVINIAVPSSDIAHSALNNKGKNEYANTADVENSVTQQQKLSCNVSENIKMQETNMNDSGFGTGSSNISKLTESSLFQSDVTFDVTFDQMKANDSAAEDSSRMDKSETGTLSESNQPPTSFCGFKTASGIEIKMSDSALRRGRKTLIDADNMNAAQIIPELNNEAERYVKDSDKEELNRSGDITLTENGMFGSQKVAVCDRNAAGNVVLEKGVKSALRQEKHPYGDSLFTDCISQVPSFYTAPGMPAEVHGTVLENAKVEELKVSDNAQSVSSFRASPPKTSTYNEETIKTGEPALDGNVIASDSGSYVTDSGNNNIVCGKELENVTLSYENEDKDNEKYAKEIGTALKHETKMLNDTFTESSGFQNLYDMPEKAKAGSDTKNAAQKLPEIAAGSEIVTNCVGFTSTCRKNVALGQEALKHTRAAFDDDSKRTYEGYRDLKSNFVGSTLEKMVESIDQALKQEKHFGAFSTASGKKVTLSEQALKHARNTLDCDVNETDGQTLKGFSTASRKEVGCSEEALKHAKDTLEGVVTKTVPGQNYKGFSTASGKKVEFSEEALKHAKHALHNAVMETDRQSFIEFSTASGKEVEFNEHALKHAKDTLDSAVKGTNIGQTFEGFSTASGKRVELSEQALKHAKQKLDSAVNEPAEKGLENGQNNEGETEKEPSLKAFSSAAGKNVELKERALKHVIETQDTVVNEYQNEQTFSGFSTGLGKKVEFSEQALNHAKNTIDIAVNETRFSVATDKKMEFGEQVLNHTKYTLASAVYDPQNEQSFTGFSTASGKKVKFSEQALKHAKDKLDSVVEKTENEHNSMGFSTASGKKVEFREQALKHAKDKLDSVVEETKTEHNSMGFSTASGKKVGFSEQALKHAKDKLDNVVEETKTELNSMGFSTASGKKVGFSEQALKHANAKLDSVVEEYKTEHNSMGFSTASGKKVGFSEQALEHAKVTLDSISKVTENEHTFMGFNTASGKKVGCSQRALEHAKQTLKDNSKLEDNQIVPPCLEAAGDGDRSTGNGMRMSIQTKNPVMLGFSTAAGKNVDVSEKALKYIKTSVLQDQPGIGDIKDIEDTDNSVDNKKSELSSCHAENSDDMDDMEEIFANALKRQKLDVNRERRLVQADSEESCTLKRKMAKTTCPDRNADKRHPGFRPFKPVFCKTNSETKNNSSLRTISSTGVPDNPSFKTPYKAPVATLNKQSATHIPSLDGQKRSSNDARNTVPDLAKGDGPGPTASESDSLILGSHGDNGGYDAVVSSSGDGTNNQVKRVPDANADIAFKSGVKELEGNVQTETVVTVLETTTGTVNDQQHKHITDNVVNCVNIVRNDSYDFDSFSQDEDDVYYCMLVEARHSQDDVIKQRSATRVQPVAGKLWNMKQTKGRWKLQDFIEKKALRQKCSLYKEVTSRTAADYKFKMERHYGKDKANVTIGDGACLVPDDSGNIGKYEIYRAFLTVEGVDSKLITDTWVYNHYRWIVWKLAAYERFSSCPQSSCLTPTMVLLQLKYRYDREVDRAQRSSIKKIYERDDTPSKRLVLCVADVKHINIDESTGAKPGHRTVLELTDGWYSIPTQIDLPLTELVHTGRICVGQKLCISGADVVGGEDACTPLEAPASIMLKICRNSTRPATWNCNLGYQSDPRPLCVPLSGLCGDGGVVGIVDVVIVRKYPTLYMEKLEGGGCTFRTSKCEERTRQEFETRKQVEMEKVYQLVESTAEKDNVKDKKVLRRKTFNRTTVDGFQTGREIYDALEEAARPDTVQNYLSEQQMSMLYEYQRQVMEETQSEIKSKFSNAWQEKSETFRERVVTPVLKFRVSGCANRDLDSKTSTILTIWRPSAEISDVQEGHRYKIYSVNTSMARSKYIGHTVQLTATKQTRYRRMQLDENILDNIYEAREVLLVSDVKRYRPFYGEMDFVGVIVKIMPSSQSNRAGDVVYLADYQTCVLAVKFSNGFKSFGEDTFVVGNILCCCNLMDKSPYRNQSIPTVDATVEFTQISNKPLNANQRKAVDRLNSSYKDKKQFINNALSAISEVLGDKEPVPEYEKIKHLNEEFKVQFPNRKHLYDHSKISNSDMSLKSTPGNLKTRPKQDHSEASCSASSLCVSVQDSNTSRSTGCTEISCDRTNIVNKADSENSVITSDVEKTNIQGGLCGIDTAASPEVNQSVTTPVTQRRRSIAQTKMSRLLSYGSPAVLSPMNLSVPCSVQRGFKPPAFKKL